MSGNQKKAYLLAILAILFWSTVASAFKITLRHIDYQHLLFFSSLISFLFLLIYGVINRQIFQIRKLSMKDILLSMALGLLNPFLYYLILFKAYDILPAQEAMTLNYTWPLILALLSVPMLGQKLSLKSIFALLISFSGIIIIGTKGNPTSLEFSNWFGDLLALGSSVIWALFWLFNVKSKLNESLKLFMNFFWGSIYILILMLFTGGIQMPDLYGMAGAAYVGIFEMGLTFVLWLKAMQLTERTDKISQLVFLSPFLSLFFIRIFVEEAIHTYTITGLILIVAGIILQQYTRKTKPI